MFEDSVKHAKRLTKHLKCTEHCDVVIAMTHVSLAQDKLIAEIGMYIYSVCCIWCMICCIFCINRIQVYSLYIYVRLYILLLYSAVIDIY